MSHVACGKLGAVRHDNAGDECIANFSRVAALPARSRDRSSRRSGALVEIEDSVLKTHLEYASKSTFKVLPLAANGQYFNSVP